MRSSVVCVATAAWLFTATSAEAIRWPWDRDHPWPGSSDAAVETLDHPTVESAFAARAEAGRSDDPYRFAAFGDQRALADGEWQELLRQIVRRERAEGDLAFLLDTGDIVYDGRKSDQFAWLRSEILAIGRHLPYLVGIGNHEVKNNRDRVARENAARFLAYLDPDLSPDRLYYRKDLGAATFLFLDTNDFVYGPDGERKACPLEVDLATREGRQIAWLLDQLDELKSGPPRLVVALMHHPLVQSSEKHLPAACSLWNFRAAGQPLVDTLADGGVDVILTGHTHTYERFRLTRAGDGAEIDLVNLSGRPRDSVLWIGSGPRRATDIAGREREFFAELGWDGLDHWTISQVEAMEKPDEANQFGLFTVTSDGRLFLEVNFLDEDSPEGLRATPTVRLH